MIVADMMKPDGRVFMKSEWGQISDYWPCVSFTKRSVGDRLRRDFRAGRDILIYVCTTDLVMTSDANHRSRLISAVSIEPSQVIKTRKIVPPSSWAESIAAWGDRWPHSMAVLSAANFAGPPYPSAREVAPQAYRSFAAIENRGSIVEANDDERAAVISLPITPIRLSLREDVLGYLALRPSFSVEIDKAIRQHIARMALGIIDRVNKGGSASVRINPTRYAPNFSDLNALLLRKWTDQKGKCTLCGGPLNAGSAHNMLQPSPDRIDSGNGSYNDENVWIKHLACNFAKNKYGRDEFEDWLETVRGLDIEAST